MSGSSDSDEFYDAEDTTPNRQIRKQRPISQIEITNDLQELNFKTAIETKNSFDKHDVDSNVSEGVKPTGRRRFHELRQCMQADEDEVGPTSTSTPDSQGSSVEGVFPAPRTTHPFRIIEHDAISLQSMSSLGRVGRILAGSIDPSGISVGRDSTLLSGTSTTLSSALKDADTSKSTSDIDSQQHGTIVNKLSQPVIIVAPSASTSVLTDVEGESIYKDSCFEQQGIIKHKQQLQEPDVIASTKTSQCKLTDDPRGPIAPPRRKKKNKNELQDIEKDNRDVQSLESLNIDSLNVEPSQRELHNQGSPLPSPASTIESLTREFEHSLDISNSNTNTINKMSINLIDVINNSNKVESSVLTNFNCAIGTSNVNNSINASVIHTNGNHQSPANSEKGRSGASSRSSITTKSLDLWMATKGLYVVKPQDEVRSKAEGPSSEELDRIERLKNELLYSQVPHTTSGHSSLGPNLKSGFSPRNSRERRKSAGDEDLLKQLNMFVRTRTDSGKQLTDLEILEQVTVLNLDTGERVPLSVAEDKLPQCINPLSLHIMRLTSEYVSTGSLNKQVESDEESVNDQNTGIGTGEGEIESEEASRLRKGTRRLKRFLGSTVKKTMDKAKSIAHARHREDVADIDDVTSPGELSIKLKASSSHKGPYEFDSLQHVQDLSGLHQGPVWCMKFSSCGRLLATAGQDRVLRVWVLRDAYTFFQDMRTKYNADQKVSPTPSQESLVSQHSAEDQGSMDGTGPFMPKPFCTYTGHTSDLLDVSWSKNYFVLSSSMDKTVRLWHISRKECLCCFQHIDFVTAIVFHPKDDRYFLSGSLDGKLRLWNIPDKKVAVWNEVDGQTKLITAANFCQNGQFAVVGSYDGRCIFYTTDQLKYHTQIHVRSTRGKNATGRKISGIEPMPGEDKILVTSNDSRIRLYDLRDLNLSCKYKGYMNVSSQIKASFSHDGKYIVSGSENQCIYIWKTHHDYSKFSSVRRDRNDFWEGIKAHNAVVTCAVFAPHPDSIIRIVEEREGAVQGSSTDSQPFFTGNTVKVEDPLVEQRTRGCGGHVLVSADFTGCIKVFINKTKPKHSSLPVSAYS